MSYLINFRDVCLEIYELNEKENHPFLHISAHYNIYNHDLTFSQNIPYILPFNIFLWMNLFFY
jgi:hypothetical protein